MYCVTNQNKNWGAASILNKDIMDEVADFLVGKPISFLLVSMSVWQ